MVDKLRYDLYIFSGATGATGASTTPQNSSQEIKGILKHLQCFHQERIQFQIQHHHQDSCFLLSLCSFRPLLYLLRLLSLFSFRAGCPEVLLLFRPHPLRLGVVFPFKLVDPRSCYQSWNYWKFQIHWNKLEWVNPRSRDEQKKSILCIF